MNCTNCGSALTQPTGFCGTCGQPTAPPPAWPPHSYQAAPDPALDVTTQFTAPGYGPPAHAAYDPPAHPAYDRPTHAAYDQAIHAPYEQPAHPGYHHPTHAAHEEPAYEHPAHAAYDQPTQVLHNPPQAYHQPEYTAPPSGLPTPDLAASVFGPGTPHGEATHAVPAQGYPPQYGPPPQPYPQPQVPGYFDVAFSNGSAAGGNRLSVIAFVLAAIGVLLPLFGVAGIVVGAIARNRGEEKGPPALKLAIGGTVLGLIVFLGLVYLVS